MGVALYIAFILYCQNSVFRLQKKHYFFLASVFRIYIYQKILIHMSAFYFVAEDFRFIIFRNKRKAYGVDGKMFVDFVFVPALFFIYFLVDLVTPADIT